MTNPLWTCQSYYLPVRYRRCLGCYMHKKNWPRYTVRILSNTSHNQVMSPRLKIKVQLPPLLQSERGVRGFVHTIVPCRSSSKWWRTFWVRRCAVACAVTVSIWWWRHIRSPRVKPCTVRSIVYNYNSSFTIPLQVARSPQLRKYTLQTQVLCTCRPILYISHY